MDFYIKNNKKHMTMTLPITPEHYEIEYKNDIETVRLTNFGDINIPTHHTPITLSLEGLFSVNKNHYLNKQTLRHIQEPMDYVDLIQNWIDRKDVVRVVITKGTKARIDLNFYIESITYAEDGETVADIKYTITFREYRPLRITTNKVAVLSATATNIPRSNNKSVDTTQRVHTVIYGDYLYKLSRKYYGTSKKWKDIYNTNRKIIGNNPNFIKVGQKLIIP